MPIYFPMFSACFFDVPVDVVSSPDFYIQPLMRRGQDEK